MLRATVIFSASYGSTSLRSLVAPNHVFCVIATKDGFLICNPLNASTDLQIRSANVDQILKSKKFERLKFAFESCLYFGAPVRDTIFGKTELLLPKDKKMNTVLQDYKPQIPKTLEELAVEYFYYKGLESIKRLVSPIAMYEVEVFKPIPESEARYSVMMFCHNIVISVLSLNVGNVLTPLDFKVKLKLLNGETNFIATSLYERPLTDKEMKLGRLI